MEDKHNVLVLLRPPSEEDKVRLVLRRKEESESGDFHGWLDNKEVWQVNKNASIPTSPHLTFIRKSLAASLKEPRCWDVTVTVSDGVRPLPRLVVALAFPLLQSCEDLLEAEALILPDYSIQSLNNTLAVLLGKEAENVRNDLEQSLLTLSPLPQKAVEIERTKENQSTGEDIPRMTPLSHLMHIEADSDEAIDKGNTREVNDLDPIASSQNLGTEPETEKEERACVEQIMCDAEKNGKSKLSDDSAKDQRLGCQICKASFSNLYSLVAHEVETHEGKFGSQSNPDAILEPVKCRKCKAEMTLASEIAAHTCTQTKYTPTRCVSCKKILVNKLQMTSHSCSPPAPSSQLSCLSCGLEFNSLRRTIIHEVEECGNLTRKDHSDFRLRVFTCNICNRHFVIQRKFKLHIERHKLEAEIDMEKESDKLQNPANILPEIPDNNENIDPGKGKPQVVGEDELMEWNRTEATGDGKNKPVTLDHTNEGDFLKAVKQLKELQDASTTCQHCGKILGSRKAVLEHEVNVHGDVSTTENLFRCELCPKVFKSKSLRSAHASTHNEERRYQCHLCALRFKTVGNLTAHLSSCHDPVETGMLKKFNCKFCSKSFRFPAQIQQHERVHTKEKPFNCQFCGKGFSVKCNLKAHLETHKSVDERTFKCSQCNHTATTLPLLKLHMHSHTGERPFVCELCGESYKRPSNLRRHKKNMCKLRSGAPLDQGDDGLGGEVEEGGIYETIETVVVQDGDEGEIIIETEGYEENQIFVDNGLLMETIPMSHHSQNVMIETTVEEGIVEEDGIKYETQLVSL